MPQRQPLVSPLLTILLIALASLGFAAPLDSRIENLISEGSAARAVWGVYAVDCRDGKVLADINARRLLVPASNRKVVTTAMAATRFSPEKTFITELRGEEVSPSGLLQGDLVLHPSGDPSWTPSLLGGRSGVSVLHQIASSAHEAGLRRVTGDLVIDTSRFREPAPLPPGWSWDNMDKSYAGLPALLSINTNIAGVTFTPARPGNPIDVSFPTSIPPFEIVNDSETLSGGAAPTLQVIRSLDGTILTIRGGMPSGASPAVRAIPLGNPVLYNARLLRAVLEDEGIRIEGEVVLDSAREKGSVLLAAISSAPIADILTVCNEDSDNFVAESLYLLCSADQYGAASYDGSHRVEEAFWKKIGVDTSEVRPADGSGLSRECAITPHALVEALDSLRDKEWYVQTLPRAGYTGTLRYRLSADTTAGRVWAKTGTLDGVSALSGYIDRGNGRMIIFSIMANNYTSSTSSIRKRIDDIVEILSVY